MTDEQAYHVLRRIAKLEIRTYRFDSPEHAAEWRNTRADELEAVGFDPERADAPREARPPDPAKLEGAIAAGMAAMRAVFRGERRG